MKKWLCAALAVLLMMSGALADGFDQAGLEQLEGCAVSMDVNGVDVVVRPVEQPYQGQTELPGSDLMVYLDFVHMPNEDATFLRLTLALMSETYLAANELTVTVGGKDYTFSVFPQVWEYDRTYYEDYVVCMTDESLPMIKAMARAKSDEFAIRLSGLEEVRGSITLPGDSVAALYDAYVDLGGTKQDLEQFRVLWPVRVSADK